MARRSAPPWPVRREEVRSSETRVDVNENIAHTRPSDALAAYQNDDQHSHDGNSTRIVSACHMVVSAVGDHSSQGRARGVMGERPLLHHRTLATTCIESWKLSSAVMEHTPGICEVTNDWFTGFQVTVCMVTRVLKASLHRDDKTYCEAAPT